MKINFDGDFKHISALLRSKESVAAAPSQGDEFGKLLSDIRANGAEKLNDSKVLSATAVTAPRTSNADLVASLKLGNSSLRPPALTPFEMPLEPALEVKQPESGVKAPTLLEAKRVDRFSGLSYSEKVESVGKLVSQYGKEFGIDPALAMAVASVESSFNPAAVSSDGHASKGLFQLLDRTGKELHERARLEPEYDPFDPQQNTQLGMQYLRRLHEIFSNPTKLPNATESTVAANSSSLEKLAVAAFNAGEGRVASAQARAKSAGGDPASYAAVEAYLPKSTQEYVGKVMQALERFSADNQVNS